MAAPPEEEDHAAHVDETGYEEDDEGGAHIKKNRTSRKSDRAQSRSGRGVKRAGSLRDSLVLKEHRWKIHDPFVVDPSESIKLDALDVTKCALHSVIVNYVEANSPIEDRFVVDIDEEIAYFGVFDGHGGVEVADFAKILLVSAVKAALYEEKILKESFTNDEAIDAVSNALRRGFVAFDRMLELKAPTSGSCAIFVLLIGQYLFVANAGDSRALLVQQNNERFNGIQLSDDFNCSNPSERERLEREHPDEPDLFENNRIKGTLDPTRGFGDFKHKLNSPELIEAMTTENSRWTPPYITAEPEVTVHKLSRKDKYLILASDGLWEKFSNSEVVEVLAEAVYEDKSIPTRLIEKFVSKTTGGLEEDKLQVLFSMNPRARRALHDDVTIVVVGIDSDKLPSSENFVSYFLSTLKPDASALPTPLTSPKIVDIHQLLSQIPHDSASESSDH